MPCEDYNTSDRKWLNMYTYMHKYHKINKKENCNVIIKKFDNISFRFIDQALTGPNSFCRYH
jgi:hypothetical protein